MLIIESSANHLLRTSTAAFQDEFESTEIGLPDEVPATDDMQTMVFSATLSKDLQQNLKRKRKSGSGKKKQEVKSSLGEGYLTFIRAILTHI